MSFSKLCGTVQCTGGGEATALCLTEEGSEWGGREVGEDSVLGGQKGDGEGGSEANTGRKAEGTVS